MKGRKKLPTHLKVVKGTARNHRLNKKEPKPANDKVKMPADLSATAKKYWNDFVNPLVEGGIATNLDIAALGLLCEAYSDYRAAQQKLDKSGMVIKTKNGNLIQSPYLSIANRNFEKLHKMLTEFGMTPSSRARVERAGEKDSDNEWEGF